MDDIVSLNICGTEFKPTRTTVNSIDGSKLSKLDKTVTVHYFDRDPSLFKHILNAHRNGVVHVPRDVCPLTFRDEMLFWGIPLQMIAPCCWGIMYEPDNEISTLKILVESGSQYNTSYKLDTVHTNLSKTVLKDQNITNDREKSLNSSSAANRLWLFLEEPGSSLAAKLWCFFYIGVVIVSVIVYMIWLQPALRVSKYLSEPNGIDLMKNDTLYSHYANLYNERIVLLVESDPKMALFTVDMLCTVFFILETISHFLLCPYKLKYFNKPYNILKVLLCVSMVISTIFEIRKDYMYEHLEFYVRFYFVFKSFNVLRLLLMFRLYKLYNGLYILLLSLRHSLRELLLLMFTFIVCVVVYGCLIFSAEIESKKFPTTMISMWWSLITMTTVGYGDFYPTTTAGYIVGTICAINGLIVLALPIATIAGTFNNLYSRNMELQKHKDEIRKEIADAHADTHGKLTKRESISTIDDETVKTVP